MTVLEGLLRQNARKLIIINAVIIVAWIIGVPICLSLLGLVSYYAVTHREFLSAAWATLPRDIGGVKLLVGMTREFSLRMKQNMTVHRFFTEEIVARHPKKVAFVDIERNREFTFVEIEELSNQFANYFHSVVGLKEGDIVALYMNNCPEYVAIWLGLSKIGVVTAWINYNLKLDPLGHSIKVSNAKLAIVGDKLQAPLEDTINAGHIDKDLPLYVYGSVVRSLNAKDLSQEVQNDRKLPPTVKISTGPKSTLYAMYIYTSGTTGLPKAALVKHIGNCVFRVGIQKPDEHQKCGGNLKFDQTGAQNSVRSTSADKMPEQPAVVEKPKPLITKITEKPKPALVTQNAVTPPAATVVSPGGKINVDEFVPDETLDGGFLDDIQPSRPKDLAINRGSKRNTDSDEESNEMVATFQEDFQSGDEADYIASTVTAGEFGPPPVQPEPEPKKEKQKQPSLPASPTPMAYEVPLPGSELSEEIVSPTVEVEGLQSGSSLESPQAITANDLDSWFGMESRQKKKHKNKKVLHSDSESDSGVNKLVSAVPDEGDDDSDVTSSTRKSIKSSSSPDKKPKKKKDKKEGGKKKKRKSKVNKELEDFLGGPTSPKEPTNYEIF